MTTVAAYSLSAPDGRFEKTSIERRELGPHDVLIDIKYAGICHSDIHTARNEWHRTRYPCIPGHEHHPGIPAQRSHQAGQLILPANKRRPSCHVPSPPARRPCRAGLTQGGAELTRGGLLRGAGRGSHGTVLGTERR